MRRLLPLALLLAAIPASAEGFADIYGGTMNFLPTTTLQNADDCGGGICVPVVGLQWAQLNNVHLYATGTGGLRVGGLQKGDFYSIGGDFNLQMYGVTAQEFYSVGPPSTAFKSKPGGTVVQPGGDFIVGVPLQFARLYGGVGLNIPILFYDYTSYDKTMNTYVNDALGASATIGYDAFVGLRFLLTNNLNVFVEDRLGGIFAPIAAKDSVLAANNTVINGTLVINSLNSNAIVFGLGLQW